LATILPNPAVPGCTVTVKTSGAVVSACSNFVDVEYAILQ